MACTARRIPAPCGAGRVREKGRSANQRAGELPLESAALSEGKQSSMPAKAPSPGQLQAAFPLTLALSLREREHGIRAATSRGALDCRKRSVRFSLSSGRGLG